MARPRKMKTDMMLKIVDDFFNNIADGNTSMLKYSLITEYAIKLGHLVAAYDFRRNVKVRNKIDEFKNTNGAFIGSKPMVYKNLNVTEFLNNNRNVERLKKSLLELDVYWSSIFEYANKVVVKNKKLVKIKRELNAHIDDLVIKNKVLTDKTKKLSTEKRQLVLENRYLKRTLKENLYPALANEILRSNDMHIKDECAISDETIGKMTDINNIKSFSEIIKQDDKMISDEEVILSKMWDNCDV